MRTVVLHPSHKLEYFKSAGWDDEWREMAVKIIRTEFEQTYARYQEDSEVGNSKEGFMVCCNRCSLHLSFWPLPTAGNWSYILWQHFQHTSDSLHCWKYCIPRWTHSIPCITTREYSWSSPLVGGTTGNLSMSLKDGFRLSISTRYVSFSSV